MEPEVEKGKTQREIDSEKREANSCIGLGLGVGALGVGGALLSAAVCPICVVVAPALVGAGMIKRIKIAKRRRNIQA